MRPRERVERNIVMELVDLIRVLSYNIGHFSEKVSMEEGKQQKIQKRILSRLHGFERSYQFLESWGAITLLELSVYSDFYKVHFEEEIKNAAEDYNVYLPTLGKISKIYEESRALYAMTEDGRRILLFSWYEHEVIDRYLIKMRERYYSENPTYSALKSIKKNNSLSFRQWTVLLLIKQLPIWTLPEEYWWGYDGDAIDLMWFIRVDVKLTSEEGELYIEINQRGYPLKTVLFKDLA